MTRFVPMIVALVTAAVWPVSTFALERLCDSAHEDCRAPLLNLINNEQNGIDVAFWFMEDTRYSSALVRAHQRGVRVRVLMDTRANVNYPGNVAALAMLHDAGIPMREKISPGIMHWKMMLFAGQQTVQFSGANYSDEAFVPISPWNNYVDEVIYFTDRPAWVQSFMTRFDDIWTTSVGFQDYANVGSIARAYPSFPIDPELNFPPGGFRERSIAAYRAETQRIDAIMYRITDRAHTDALIDVAANGVPVRLYTEQLQYRDPTRLWHAWNVDRLWKAGQSQRINGEPAIHIRHRRHAGLSHEKLVVLRGQTMSIFGSSNWTSPSSDTQLEHNLFTRDLLIYEWTRTHFDRKWFNQGPVPETQPFVPLAPDVPRLVWPASGSVNQPTKLTLLWDGGPWAHRYDLYLGTDPGNLARVVDDKELGPYGRSWTVEQDLAPGTTYYWRVVGRTMADIARSTPVCSFRTAGTGTGATPSSTCSPAPPQPPDPVAVNEPQDVGPPPPATPTPPLGGGRSNGDPVDAEPSPGGGPSSGTSSLPSRRVPTVNGTYTGGTAIRR